MDHDREELLSDDDESDLNSTIVAVNGSDVVRVNVGVGGVATGIALYVLSFLTFVGNAMVLHAIRTEKRLQTVSERGFFWCVPNIYLLPGTSREKFHSQDPIPLTANQ